MNYKIFYGARPKLTDRDKSMFSRNGYRCDTLLQNRKGMPVVISRSTDQGPVIWKVEHDFSCVLFGTRKEAMAYCEGRFLDLEGRPLTGKGTAANV